jgi:hypothetical protein
MVSIYMFLIDIVVFLFFSLFTSYVRRDLSACGVSGVGSSSPAELIDQHVKVAHELASLTTKRLLHPLQGTDENVQFTKVLFVPQGSADRFLLETMSNKGFNIISIPLLSGAEKLMNQEIKKFILLSERSPSRSFVCLCSSTAVCDVLLSQPGIPALIEFAVVHNDFFLETYIHRLANVVVRWNEVLSVLQRSSSGIGGETSPTTMSLFNNYSFSNINNNATHNAVEWSSGSNQVEDTSGNSWDNVSAITNPTILSSTANGLWDKLGEQSQGRGHLLNNHHQINNKEDFDLDSQSISKLSMSSFGVEENIELPTFSIFVFLDKLIQWGNADATNSLLRRNYMYGEDSSSYDHSFASNCKIVLENRLGKYFLVISGGSANVVELRSSKIKQLVEKASDCHQLLLLPGWTAQHKRALLSSEILKQQQELTKVSVTWSATDDGISVELTSLSKSNIVRMSTFLTHLQPVTSLWRIPKQKMMMLDQSDFDGLQSRYALKLDAAAQERLDVVSIHVNGFAEFLEQAYSALLTGSVAQKDLSRDSRLSNTWSPSMISSYSTNNTAMSSRSQYEQETIKKLHRGTYSFADREAGIFFFAFEQQFRDYLEKSFSVLLDDSDNSADYRPKALMNEVTLDNMFNKNVVLKISFYGNQAKHVSAARAYLEQLNTTNLARVQIFFPQVSIKKFKEIYNRKSSQMTILNNERLRSMHTNFNSEYSQFVVDPLHSSGFVNIRMKPPMHCHGIRKMSLPADVTVTICGSVLAQGNEDLLKEVELVFNSIPSDYLYVSVSIPYTHPLKKQLTIKTMREEMIYKYGLIALKWEEGCRATGSVGTAKIWTMSQASMDALLDQIRSAEMENSKLGGGGLGFCFSPQSQFEVAFAQSTMPPHAVASLTGSLNGLGLSGCTNNSDDSLSPQTPETRAVVNLPDLTLRYVLLGPPLNGEMAALLQKFSDQGIRTKYPYRDRTDPHAAVLFEGDTAVVSTAVNEANTLIQTAVKELNSVQVLVTDDQYRIILSSDLSCVKYIQGQAGVHMKLDPTQTEMEQAVSLFDVRSIRTEYNTKISMYGYDAQRSDNLVDSALVGVVMSSMNNLQPNELIVMPKMKQHEPWMNKLQRVIMLHFSDATPQIDSFSEEDRDCLIQGKCVFQRKDQSSLVAHWLWKVVDEPTSVDESLQSLQDMLSNLLNNFLQQGSSTVAVVVPSQLDQSDLTVTKKQQTIMKTLLAFCKTCRWGGIRIFCAEYTPEIPFLSTREPIERYPLCLDSSQVNGFAQILLQVIDQPVDGQTSNRGLTAMDSCSVGQTTMSICNLPQPKRSPMSSPYGLSRGTKLFVMKGLLPGLQSGLEILRHVLYKGGVTKT